MCESERDERYLPLAPFLRIRESAKDHVLEGRVGSSRSGMLVWT